MTILASQCYSKSIVITHSPRILPLSVSLKQAKKHATCQFHMIQNKAFCKGHLHVHPKMKLCSLAQLPGKRSGKPRNLIDSIVFASIQPFQSYVLNYSKSNKKNLNKKALTASFCPVAVVTNRNSSDFSWGAADTCTMQTRSRILPTFKQNKVKNIAHIHIKHSI